MGCPGDFASSLRFLHGAGDQGVEGLKSGEAALCAGGSGPLECWPARSSRAGLFALGRSEAPSVYSGGRHAECSALLKAAQAQPSPLLIPAIAGGPMRVGDKRSEPGPSAKSILLIYSVRWVRNRFRQTADPRSQGSELKSSGFQLPRFLN